MFCLVLLSFAAPAPAPSPQPPPPGHPAALLGSRPKAAGATGSGRRARSEEIALFLVHAVRKLRKEENTSFKLDFCAGALQGKTFQK